MNNRLDIRCKYNTSHTPLSSILTNIFQLFYNYLSIIELQASRWMPLSTHDEKANERTNERGRSPLFAFVRFCSLLFALAVLR